MSAYIDMLYPGIPSGWYVRFAKQAAVYADYGIVGVLVAPVCLTLFTGASSVSAGYDPVSDIDHGQNGVAPRGGTLAECRAFCEATSAVGMSRRLDFPHQYGIDGDNPPYLEKDAAGKVSTKLAYKPKAVFEQSEDRSGVYDISGSRGMGQRVNYWAKLPSVRPRYMLDLKLECFNYLLGCFGAPDFRTDNGKDEEMRTLVEFNRLGNQRNLVEIYDGNVDKHLPVIRKAGYISFAFPDYFIYRDVSNGAPLSDMVRRRRLAFEAPGNCWLIVENHDTDGPNGIVRGKGWFYFDAATTPAAGFDVYWGDLERYGLWDLVKGYVWIHQVLAWGKRSEAVTETDLIMWTRDGDGGYMGQSGGLMCGISRDPINTQWRWAYHPKWRNEWVENYARSGGPRVWVNEWGWGNYPLPPNSWDRCDNAIAYSRPGQGRAIKPKPSKVRFADPYDYSRLTVKL